MQLTCSAPACPDVSHESTQNGAALAGGAHRGSSTERDPGALQLQLNVVRYAMVDMLKRPPPGFEDVVTGHFRLMRHRYVLLQDCIACAYSRSIWETLDK